ncbi:MAG: ATP-binding cassette domain-containing protein [Oligoflexia bacterium]|nr:ATP-binding cassette domain-containing protein [Oligoflexia bacterium]
MIKRERITHFEILNLNQSFDQNELFKDINLDIKLGKIISVMGSPGCGKSLFLKIISGLVEPTSGEVILNERNVYNLSFEETVPFRLSMAVCFENGGLLMNKSIDENIKLSLLYHNQWRSERSQKLYDNLIYDFKLKPYLHLRPAQVSSGVRKIAGLVRAFLLNPQILILDEPSLGIGPEAMLTLKKWIEIFRSEHDDKVVIMATQDIAFTKLLKAEVLEIKNKTLLKVAS